MPRLKSLPDTAVLAAARRLFVEGGEKSVSFGTVARATGLAASTLAQRFGTVDGMLAAAARDGWATLAEETAGLSTAAADKGPQGLLKALDGPGRLVPLLLRLGAGDEAATASAALWRAQVESELARRLGGGDKQADRSRQAAQALFATWQGQLLWGDSDLRLKDIAKKLT